MRYRNLLKYSDAYTMCLNLLINPLVATTIHVLGPTEITWNNVVILINVHINYFSMICYLETWGGRPLFRSLRSNNRYIVNNTKFIAP